VLRNPLASLVRHSSPMALGVSFTRYLSGTFNRFLDDDCTTMAAAIAYYTTFSVAPLLLIVVSVVGLIFGRAAVEHQIETQIAGLVGSGTAKQVAAMVESAGRHNSTGIPAAVLGLAALLLGATGAFAQLQSSLNTIWRVRPDPRVGGVKNFLLQRVLSFGMIMAIAFLLLVSLAVTAAIAAFGDFLSSFLPAGFSGELLQLIGFLVSFATITALFATIYKLLPDAVIRWREVWFGAGITSLLFTIGKSLIGAYLGRSGASNAYGAAGSLVLLVLWIYYSSIVFLIGAEFTEVWAETHAGPAHPKPGAVCAVVQKNIQPQIVT
jgi:membrane protein